MLGQVGLNQASQASNVPSSRVSVRGRIRVCNCPFSGVITPQLLDNFILTHVRSNAP